ncbi:hypothetical protein HDV64DRAFT_72903 [Trichoderma sp. TUCIM 5745]
MGDGKRQQRLQFVGLAGLAPGLLLLLLLNGGKREGKARTRQERDKSGSKCWELFPLDSIDSSHQVLRHAPSRCDLPRSITRCIAKGSDRAPSGRVSLHVLLNPSPHAARRADHEQNCGHQLGRRAVS